MYAVAEKVEEFLNAARAAGRPPTGEPAKSGDEAPHLALFEALRDWLLEHPGAVSKADGRLSCSDGYRAFVVDLFGPGGLAQLLSREATAQVLGLSRHTLAHWLSPSLPAIPEPAAEAGPPPVDSAPDEVETSGRTQEPPAMPPEGEASDQLPEEECDAGMVTGLPRSAWAAQAVQVITLWEKWEGGLATFCRTLPEHGINYSYGVVRNILALAGKRRRRAGRPHHPDAEALRGELTRMFANAQWHGDGKNVQVRVGDALYRFNWELVVDNETTGHLGFSIQDNENCVGVLESLEQAEQTAGGPPIAFMRDPRKSNTAKEIEEKLAEKNVTSMFPTTRRPQTNSPVETEFGLFEQKMRPISIPEGLGGKELARLVLWYVLFAYSAGRNQTPRQRLRHKSPAQAFKETSVTDEEKAIARERFNELKRQVEEQEASNRNRCAPAIAALLADFFGRHNLHDPRNTYIPQIGAYGPEAALEAMAIFAAKQEAGTLPDRHHERYLLGIARQVAYRREDERTYEQLIELRAKAGDLVIKPLIQHEQDLRSKLPTDRLPRAILDLALTSPTQIDRVFWRSRFLDLFSRLTQPRKQELGRWSARRIVGRSSLHHRERDHFIALLAEAASPLAA
ncbi:MAG: transposase family protein [Deltaproteobacteria bacterium]|nr:transposase family protein [Deltaproteobacteria bacterium]